MAVGFFWLLMALTQYNYVDFLYWQKREEQEYPRLCEGKEGRFLGKKDVVSKLPKGYAPESPFTSFLLIWFHPQQMLPKLEYFWLRSKQNVKVVNFPKHLSMKRIKDKRCRFVKRQTNGLPLTTFVTCVIALSRTQNKPRELYNWRIAAIKKWNVFFGPENRFGVAVTGMQMDATTRSTFFGNMCADFLPTNAESYVSIYLLFPKCRQHAWRPVSSHRICCARAWIEIIFLTKISLCNWIEIRVECLSIVWNSPPRKISLTGNYMLWIVEGIERN